MTKKKEVQVKELNDYSGPLLQDLRPNKSLEPFSKELLYRLTGAGIKLFLGLEGCWYTLNRKRFGEQKAMEMDRELTLERLLPQEVARLRKLFDIWGTDVTSFMKFCQIEPLMALNLNYSDFKLKNKNVGIVTVNRCRALEYWERHGETALQKNACGTHMSGLQKAALEFHPDMKVRPSKLPPRELKFGKSGYEKKPIACQWEVRLEQKG